MNRETIAKRVIELIYENEIVAPATVISIDTSLYAVYGLDSIKVINLIMALEADFKLEFNESELDFSNFESVDKICSLIIKKFDIL